MQTNHFDQPGTSISVSVATIPMGVFSFTGVIIGLWHQGRLYAFTTYNGARLVRFDFSENKVFLRLERGTQAIEIQAEREIGGYLAAPTLKGMDRRIMESLNGRISVSLKKKDRMIFNGVGLRAGMEIVGNMSELDKLRKT